MQKNCYKFALYVSMFPQLVAGPIVRYEQIAYEIDHRQENMEDFSLGMTRFVYGLGKRYYCQTIWERSLIICFIYPGTRTFPQQAHGWGNRLYTSDLLRFLRVFGYGDWSWQNVWFSFSGELQLSVCVKKYHRILAQMAYVPVKLVS